jgi:hypothetical protein
MKQYHLSEPFFLRNLVTFPIHVSDGSSHENDMSQFNPLTLDDVLRQGQADVRELDIPDMTEIVFDNRGNEPVALLDGEEITGSLQNRIIARSHVVAARSTTSIPVVCVEEGRWDEIGGFQTGYCSYPRIRSILAQSLHKKIDTQKTIWDEISRKLTATKTLSKTSSMHEIYDNLHEELERYVEGFSSFNHNTVGFIGCAGNQILGCDLFSNANIYQKFEQKLIRSYALDAVEYQRAKKGLPDAEQFFTRILSTLESKKFKKSSKTIPMKGGGFIGHTLMYRNRFVHLSAFPA